VLENNQLKTGFVLVFFLFLFIQSAVAQFCANCIDISSQKYSYKPSERVLIFLDVLAADIPDRKVDAYVAIIHPSGNTRFIYQISSWRVRDAKNKQVIIEPLENKEIGQYQLYFILARIDSDPFDNNNWLAAKNIDIFFFPENWQAPGQEVIFSNNSGLPQLVAHGGGEVSGQLVTNSLQAIYHAYNRGQRFFELDFSWTVDQKLVLIHDWDITYRRLFSQNAKAPSLKEFDQLLMNYGLTQLNFEQLLSWLNDYPDVKVVTDIKDRNLEGLAYIAERAGDAQKQFVPQIFAASEYNQAAKLGFKDIIFTLYRTDISDSEVLDFVKKNTLFALTLPANRAIKGSLAQDLKGSGVFVYAHTVNHSEVYEYLQGRGVDGIYTDKLFPVE
jgi:glycerophosphoryl diester phosphodiesterase